MSFLQPWMLFALPLVALPILIHLLNRHRHRSVRRDESRVLFRLRLRLWPGAC